MTSARDVDEMLADLTRTLWQQRRLLERVRYHMKVQELILAGTDDSGPERDNAVDDIINRFLHDITRAVDEGQDGVRRLFDALDEIRVERKCLAVQPRELDHVTSFRSDRRAVVRSESLGTLEPLMRENK